MRLDGSIVGRLATIPPERQVRRSPLAGARPVTRLNSRRNKNNGCRFPNLDFQELNADFYLVGATVCLYHAVAVFVFVFSLSLSGLDCVFCGPVSPPTTTPIVSWLS